MIEIALGVAAGVSITALLLYLYYRRIRQRVEMKAAARGYLMMMDDAAADVGEKWRYLNSVLAFKAGVSLHEQISLCLPPIVAFMHEKYPIIVRSKSGLSAQTIAFGIIESGTHEPEVLRAACSKIWPYLSLYRPPPPVPETTHRPRISHRS